MGLGSRGWCSRYDARCRAGGTEDLDYLSRYDGLRALRRNPLGEYALGHSDAYTPPAAEKPLRESSKVLPNHDIVATGLLPVADRLTLDAYATKVNDHVWTLRSDTILAAIEAGRTGEQLIQFLTSRTSHQLPTTVIPLVADMTARAGKMRDLGVVRLIECADAALATLIARDRKLRSHCHQVGEQHLAVPLETRGRLPRGSPQVG